MISSPVFLVGAERSGTTMLRLMLDGHPGISLAEEFEYAVEYLEPSRCQTQHREWPATEKYLEALADNRIYLLHQHQVSPRLAYPQLVDTFLAQLVDCPTKQAIALGATLHFGIEKLLWIWPDARFIHIVRDPRDVAPSHLRMAFAGNVWAALDKWLEAEDGWGKVKAQIPASRWIETRFDLLIEDYEHELRRICVWLDLDYDPAMLSYPLYTDYSLPHKSRTSDWREILTPRQVRIVEARVGHRLEELGLGLSGFAPLKVGPMREKWLRLDSKLRRPQRRSTVVGWPLTMAEVGSARIGPEELRRWVSKRSDHRINQSRKRSWASAMAELDP